MKAYAKEVPVPKVAVTLDLEPDEAHLLAHLVCGYELMRGSGTELKGCQSYQFIMLEQFAKKVRVALENVGVKPVA